MYIPNSNPKWLVNGMLSDGLWLGLRRSLTRNWPNHTKSLRDLGDSSGTRSRRSWSSRPWSLPLCKYAWNFTSWPTWRSKSSEDLPKLKPMLTTKNPPRSRKPPNWCKWCGTYIILFWTAWDVASCCKPRWFTVLMSFCCMQHTKRGFFDNEELGVPPNRPFIFCIWSQDRTSMQLYVEWLVLIGDIACVSSNAISCYFYLSIYLSTCNSCNSCT